MVPHPRSQPCEGVKRLPIPKSTDLDEEAAPPEFRMSWSGRRLLPCIFSQRRMIGGKDATTRCSSASAKLPTGCR